MFFMETGILNIAGGLKKERKSCILTGSRPCGHTRSGWIGTISSFATAMCGRRAESLDAREGQ